MVLKSLGGNLLFRQKWAKVETPRTAIPLRIACPNASTISNSTATSGPLRRQSRFNPLSIASVVPEFSARNAITRRTYRITCFLTRNGPDLFLVTNQGLTDRRDSTGSTDYRSPETHSVLASRTSSILRGGGRRSSS